MFNLCEEKYINLVFEFIKFQKLMKDGRFFFFFSLVLFNGGKFVLGREKASY